MPDDQRVYMESLGRVKQYIPAISKIMKGHCKGYKLIHRSMRSGVLDTNKLAEAFQGVPTVYLREGEVKTDKVAVCVLIDESGSMGGVRIQAARDTAILINEAIGQVPNVELFIYGHSGDMKREYSTEMYVYREKGYVPKFSLGSVRARSQNRDGIAILETAKRVRKQTKNPVLFFILSDGAPCAGAYGGESAMRHVRECVTKTEQLGFYVIQVCINHSYDPGKMFRNYVIMENMSEGLILLAADQRILMHNHSAEELLDAPACDYSGQPFVALARNAVLHDAVNSALNGKSSAVNIDSRDRIVRCYISPVTDHGALNGVLLFLLDETAQYRAEQIRAEFSANVSHELKTPLTSISGLADLLNNGMVYAAQVP